MKICHYLFFIVFTLFVSISVSADPSGGPALSIDTSAVTPVGVQKAIGTDADKLFVYVRDTIVSDGYSGILRGPKGALLSHAANSIDKALLLQELLRDAGYSTRLAHGRLGSATDALLKAVLAGGNAPAASAPAKLTSEQQALLDAVAKQTAEQYNLIAKILSDAKIKIPQNTANLAGILDDHYWVQFQAGDHWVDLDPSFPQAKTGDAFCPPTETLDQPPDSLFHYITINVKLEELKDGKIQPRTLLTVRLKAADLSGSAIFLTHQKGSWEKPAPALVGVSNALGAFSAPTIEDKAKPILVLPNDYKVGEVFDIVHPAHEGKSAPAPASLGDFGSLFGGSDNNAPPSILPVREWLEFKIESPDGQAETTERVIFDRIGYAARQNGATKPSTDPLGIKHPLASFFCITVDTGPLVDPAIFTQTTNVNGASGPSLGDVLATVGHVLAILSDKAAASLSIADQPVRYTVSSPRLWITSLRTSQQTAQFSIDERTAHYLAFAAAPKLAAKNFQLHLVRSVADGVTEANLGDFLFSNDASAASKVNLGTYSAVRVFNQALAKKIEPMLFSKNSDIAGASDEAKARLQADLAAGGWAVVPSSAVSLNGTSHLGWWRIDPSTGAAVAMTEDGLHGDSDEYATIVYTKQTESSKLYTIYNVNKGEWSLSYLQNLSQKDLPIFAGSLAGAIMKIYISLQ